jgi:hypothetical protein
LVDAEHRPEWERVVIGFLAAAWGCIVALPFVAVVRRITAAERLAKLTPRRVRRGRLARAANAACARVAACTPVRAVGGVLRAPTRARRARRRDDEMLREMARRAPGARALADTLRTSTRLGSPAAPALARLASEVRADLRRRAEARARTVPVRLCFPLVGCILPAFALLTVVPAVVAGVSR